MPEEANTEDVKEQAPVESVAATEETTQEAQEPQEGSKEFNWRRMEQKVNDLERKNDELYAAAQKVAQPTPQAEPQEDLQLEDDDLITVAQSDKRAKKMLAEELDKRDKAKLPAKAKADFKDFDQVVTTANLEQLIKEDPDLEHDIQVARNPHARAYKAIKQAQFYRAKNENKESEQRMDENSQKPVSSNSLGKQRPLSHANDYAKGSADLLAEMQQYRGGSI